MKKIWIVLFLSVSLAVSCSPRTGEDDGKLNVVATIGMIADVARNIGGDYVSVTGLMGPGVDPHQYKATARDLQRLGSADIILYNGLHLEAKMGEVFEKLEGRTVTIPVAESIPVEKLLGEGSATHDPHVWFDVSLWTIVADEIHAAFSEADPENAAEYRANYTVYRAKLVDLEAEVQEAVAELPEERRVLITAHDAFGYFGEAYGFRVMGLQGLSTVSEAGTQNVRKLADFIADNRIPAIFVESSVPKKNIEALRAAVNSRGYNVQIGGELFSDAMGDAGTEEGTYIGMVRHNVHTIVGALAGSGE
ncbi:MAG: metal ABC transporter solute-binding protein, Zn/Mn family [Spirochaetota bacterium]